MAEIQTQAFQTQVRNFTVNLTCSINISIFILASPLRHSWNLIKSQY
jgi:hypothetical protein